MASHASTSSSAAPAASAAIDRLIGALDALGPRPACRDIERVLQEVRLAPDDIAPFVRTDTRRYHRERVVMRDAYELLVMTWLPGQASVPHDHGTSVCAMRVLQGTAEERTYELLEDGTVQPRLAERFHADRVVAGDDAAIHSVHHGAADGSTLVTLHVYSPPLRDFRRFMQRTESDIRVGRPTARAAVSIVGGGFCGSMVAANLLLTARAAGTALDVHLFDRRGIVGEGVAYGTREAGHLLNVPASGMSAWTDRPDDFLKWARSRDASVGAYDFLSRRDYGDYLRHTLQRAAREADGSHLHLHADEVRRVVRDGTGPWMVHAARGASITCDAVVLAPGHRPPENPLEGRWQGSTHRLIADPWTPFAVADIAPDEPVALIGTGLSAIDVVTSLTAPDAPRRTAPIWMLSRRGLLPRAHAPAPVKPLDMAAVVQAWEAGGPVPRIRELLHAVRATAESAPDWRACIDGLRPFIQRIWSRLDLVERRRFLRHLRAFWEVHRHRTAPQVAQRMTDLAAAGAFELIRGRPLRAQASGDRVQLEALVHARSAEASLRRFDAAWVVNCSGPTPSSAAHADPAVQSLCLAGLARVDALGLGLDTDDSGRALAASGEPVPELWVVGTLRKAQLWESTAVPELRAQAASAARAVLERVSARHD